MKHVKYIIFDADDTLWENNIHYLKATNDFFNLLGAEGINRRDSEKSFEELELKVVKDFGYGSINFVFILKELYDRYKIDNSDNRIVLNSIIEKFNSHKFNQPNLFQDVSAIFKQLSKRYHLYILTKGDYSEQKSKILKSGLSEYIKEYFILDEKDDEAYAKLLSKNNWQPEETCMIGNSPKSDINPALRNNMYAIHIPYRDTWKIDIEPIVNSNGKFKQVSCFKELADIFLS